MTRAENKNHARSYLQKAQEYLDSAEDNLDLGRATPAAGDAIHAGISAKDAIVTALTGATSKAKDHAKAARELRQALGAHSDAATAEKSLRELISVKGDVELSRTPRSPQAVHTSRHRFRWRLVCFLQSRARTTRADSRSATSMTQASPSSRLALTSRR